MRKRVALITTAVMMALSLSFSSVAFAADCTGPKKDRPAACKGVGPDQGKGSQQTGP
jgi:hypothetical protein